MSSHYYVDTSVILSLYREESISIQAEEIVSANSCYISSLTEVEFNSAVSRWVRTKEIDEDQAKEIDQLFAEELQLSVFKMVPMSERNYWQASQWLQQRTTSLRTLDAIQLAICKSTGYALLTADKLFAKAAKELGSECRLLEVQ